MSAPVSIPTFKKVGELLGGFLADTAGIDIVNYRVSGTWGPLGHLDPFFAAPALLHAAARGTAPDLSHLVGPAFADGGLDLTYVKDTGRAIALLQLADKLNHRTYNVGSGRATTNAEIAEAIKKVVPDARVDLPTGGDATHLVLDISRLQKDTGYQVEYDTERAVGDYIAFGTCASPALKDSRFHGAASHPRFGVMADPAKVDWREWSGVVASSSCGTGRPVLWCQPGMRGCRSGFDDEVLDEAVAEGEAVVQVHYPAREVALKVVSGDVVVRVDLLCAGEFDRVRVLAGGTGQPGLDRRGSPVGLALVGHGGVRMEGAECGGGVMSAVGVQTAGDHLGQGARGDVLGLVGVHGGS